MAEDVVIVGGAEHHFVNGKAESVEMANQVVS